MFSNDLPITQCALEEIALEGLEGITVEGLWKRLSVRLKFSLPLPPKLTETLWSYVKKSDCLSFFVLPVDREPLKIFDRVECVDPETGSPIDPETCPYNDYKFNPITTSSVRGSCEHFDTRKEISNNEVQLKSLADIDENPELKYRFVIVASQTIRRAVLIPRTFSPDLKLTISNYCVLERLARSRYNGELANGKYSLAEIVGDPTHFHSIKKKLVGLKLIKTQLFQRTVDQERHSPVTQLLHLPRFFSIFKPRYVTWTERVVEYLKSRPNYSASYAEARTLFDESLRMSFRRLVKHSLFNKFISPDGRVPYRSIYPNAKESEWKLRNGEERSVHALSLRNPDINVNEIWKIIDEDDVEEREIFLDRTQEVIEIPLLVQVYDFIRSSKAEGVSEPDIGRHFGLGRLERRALVKAIKRTDVEQYVTNVGRQKIRKFLLPEHNKLRKLRHTNDQISSIKEEITAHEIQPIESTTSTQILQNEASANHDMEIDEVVASIRYEETRLEDGENVELSNLIAEKDIETKITEITRTKLCAEKKFKTIMDEKTLTERMLGRYRFMNSVINTNKFIDNPSKLYIALLAKERSDGMKDRMCKKTFHRLLSCLSMNNRIRLWRIIFKYKEKLRALTYITSNDIDSSYSMMQSCIRQARNRFILAIHSEVSKRANIVRTKNVPKKPVEASAIIPGSRITPASKRVSNYGSTPKFVRMRTLHEFLFYLAYEHSCDSAEVIDSKDAIAYWKEHESFLQNFDDLTDLPSIYSLDINWKMFIPPMPQHIEFGEGWCLTSDCLMRMPLSVFVRIVNVPYEVRGLDEFLSHPIKKHFLMDKLPVDLQQAMFHRRKYVISVDEILRRLCCIGLAQVGPQRLQAKDNRFYFLNRKVALLDTISSEPGYLLTSIQEYPGKSYELNSLLDVHTYWDDMYRICMATKLNRRTANDNRMIPRFKHLKDDLVSETCKPVHAEQARANDIGVLPGDRRGAAGLDSSFFAHLERNWSFTPNSFKMQGVKVRSNFGSSVRLSKLLRISRQGTKQSGGRSYKLTASSIRRRQPIRRRRTAAAPSPKRIHNNAYDDVDRAALKLMSSSRVDWNTKEDNFLLLCRLAQMYLTSITRPIPSSVIRDLLHWHCRSLNKTSRACARRVLYIMKKFNNSQQINHSVLNCLGEIKENKAIHRRFGDLATKLRKIYPNEIECAEAMKVHFVDLVYTLSSQYYNLRNSSVTNTIALPDTLDEFHATYHEKDELYNMNTIRFETPQNKDDIELSTIISLIHSTMCCNYDKTSWSIQLYEVYKDFAERQLSVAMQKVRAEQLISVNKVGKRQMEQARNRCLPLSASSYHLSITYQQQMFTKISYDLFDGAFGLLRDIIDSVETHRNAYGVNTWNSTMCFLLTEMSHKQLFDVEIEVPKRILILDPSKHLQNEAYERMIARFSDGDYVDLDESVAQSSPANDTAKVDDPASLLAAKLQSLPAEACHLMCIICSHGQRISTKECHISADGKCSLNCLKSNDKASNASFIKSLLEQREIYARLSAEDQRRVVKLPDEVEIDDKSILSVYSLLAQEQKPNSSADARYNANVEIFKQLLDIVEETMTVHEKRNVSSLLGQDLDFDEYYDSRKNSNGDGDVDITDKQHKFHDFLYVKTCKLTLEPLKNNEPKNEFDIPKLIKTREKILENVTENALWTPKSSLQADFVKRMMENGFYSTECHLGIDIHAFIESKKELGATSLELTDKYEDKDFLLKILNILIELKMVLKTGVCQLTFVHRSYVKPWIVLTYHLKRLERESLEPMTKKLMEVSDTSSTPCELKRKIDDAESTASSLKRGKIETAEEPAGPSSRSSSRLSKKLETVTIARGKQPSEKSLPSKKETFALKMSPWIRINGSLNRRVLDKYLGTILLHCIENSGLTLFQLCTRFHYLTPVHIKEAVDYLEEFGCLTRTAFVRKPKATLFSSYESPEIRQATELDEFNEVMIEPTIDAVTRLSVFIGDRKYKEDFI